MSNAVEFLPRDYDPEFMKAIISATKDPSDKILLKNPNLSWEEYWNIRKRNGIGGRKGHKKSHKKSHKGRKH